MLDYYLEEAILNKVKVIQILLELQILEIE